jgi:hypothetical protein
MRRTALMFAVEAVEETNSISPRDVRNYFHTCTIEKIAER